MEDLTEDVLKLLDHLNIKQIGSFIGLSIGAAVGLIFGAKYPDRESNANHATRILYGREKGPHALGYQSICRWFKPEWRAANPDRFKFAEQVYCSQSMEGYEASIAALRVMNLFPYAEIVGQSGDGARFVLVTAELDGTVPRESADLGKIMGSEVVVVPGSGHITNGQLPEEFYAVIKQVI